MKERIVRLLRKPVETLNIFVVNHWAIQVVEEDERYNGLWYEVKRDVSSGKDDDTRDRMLIHKSRFYDYASGLCTEEVGKTVKTDDEIEIFIKRWLQRNYYYQFATNNCQKFGLQFIKWLTDGKYLVKKIGDAATSTNPLLTNIDVSIDNVHQTLQARGRQIRVPLGPVMVRARGIYFESDMRHVLSFDGPGYGYWKEASLSRAELAFPGFVSIYIDFNINTGFGIRDGNFEFYFLGVGFSIGTDGLQISIPICGVCLRFLSWPINFILSFYKYVNEPLLYYMIYFVYLLYHFTVD